MDSTGLGTLAVALHMVGEKDSNVSIIGARDRILRLLSITRLDRLVTVLPGPGFPLKRQAPSTAGRQHAIAKRTERVRMTGWSATTA